MPLALSTGQFDGQTQLGGESGVVGLHAHRAGIPHGKGTCGYGLNQRELHDLPAHPVWYRTRYYRAQRTMRDGRPWVKVSVRGNEFRATAEQVLNHMLPALAGVNPKVSVEVQHHHKAQGTD